MDVETILLAAGSVLGAKTLEESAKHLIAEAWTALKERVRSHGGADPSTVDMLNQLENSPAGAPPSLALLKKGEALSLSSDPEIAILLHQLEALLQRHAPQRLTEISKQYNFHGGVFNNPNFS